MDRTHHSLKHWSLFSSSLFNSPPVKFYTPSPFVSDPFSHARKLEYELLISSDEFRMFEFKIRKCTRSRSHDWTDCPYAHHGEKARRRDPRIYPYSGISCPDFRRGKCMRGVHCEFAHGIFEFWLHPFKYRTLMCQEGNVCRRKVCFFAHSPEQLRSPTENSGRQCNCCLYRRAAPVDPMDLFYLVSWLKRLEMEEGCGAKVSGGYGEDTLFSEADFRWVSELVRDE